MKFWNWLSNRLGIDRVYALLDNIDLALDDIAEEQYRLRKKVTKPCLRHDQVERNRSERQHPRRHH